MNAPVVLFVYNRPSHTYETLKALSENIGVTETDIFVFADGPKNDQNQKELDNIAAVRKIIIENPFDLRIHQHFSDVNKGLANSVVDGINEVFTDHECLIVIEDDLVCSKYFLTFMNQCLATYKDELKVMHVGGYTPPIKGNLNRDIYFLRFATSWGWATWKRSWKKFNNDAEDLMQKIMDRSEQAVYDFNDSHPFFDMLAMQARGEIDSWAVRWNATVFTEDGLAVYPAKSLVKNIGFDGSGVHSGNGNWYQTKNQSTFNPEISDVEVKEDERARSFYADFYKGLNRGSVWQKIKDKIKYELKNAKGSSH